MNICSLSLDQLLCWWLSQILHDDKAATNNDDAAAAAAAAHDDRDISTHSLVVQNYADLFLDSLDAHPHIMSQLIQLPVLHHKTLIKWWIPASLSLLPRPSSMKPACLCRIIADQLCMICRMRFLDFPIFAGFVVGRTQLKFGAIDLPIFVGFVGRSHGGPPHGCGKPVAEVWSRNKALETHAMCVSCCHGFHFHRELRQHQLVSNCFSLFFFLGPDWTSGKESANVKPGIAIAAMSESYAFMQHMDHDKRIMAVYVPWHLSKT